MTLRKITGGLGACIVALSLYGGNLPEGIQERIDHIRSFVVKIVKHDEGDLTKLKATILANEKNGTIVVTTDGGEQHAVRRAGDIQIAIRSLVFLRKTVNPRATFPALFNNGKNEQLVHISCSLKGTGEQELECSM